MQIFKITFGAVLTLLSSLSFGGVIDRVEMDLRSPDQKYVFLSIAKIESKMGVLLDVPMIVQNAKREMGPSLLVTLNSPPVGTHAFTASVNISTDNKWYWAYSNPLEKCLIYFTPEGKLSTGFLRQSIINHEVFHCFQFKISGNQEAAVARASWVTEGSATFVGEDLITESSLMGKSCFDLYAREVKNIFERSYDSYPFFLHLQKSGVNVYQLFKRFYEGGTSNFVLWQDVVNTISHDALITWASSLARIGEWGPKWNYIVKDYNPPYSGTRFPYTETRYNNSPLYLRGELGLPRHDMIVLPENELVKVSIENGVGAIFYKSALHPEGNTFHLHENKFIQFCRGDHCDCPDTTNIIRTIKVTSEFIFIASLGTRGNQGVKIENGARNCCSNQGLFDSRLIGTWHSDLNRLLQIWSGMPRLPGGQETSASGNVEIVIGSGGEFVKRYQKANLQSIVTSSNRGTETTNFNLDYEISGCLTTRAINASKGLLFLTDVLDQVELHTTADFGHGIIRHTHAHGEWIFGSVCVQGEDCSGSYYFEGNNLRFVGGVANNPYPNLVKVITE